MAKQHWSSIFAGIAQGLNQRQERDLKERMEKRQLKLLESKLAFESGIKEDELAQKIKEDDRKYALDLAKVDLEKRKLEPYIQEAQGPPTAEGIGPAAVPILLGQMGGLGLPGNMQESMGQQPVTPDLLERLRPLMQTAMSQEGAGERAQLSSESALARVMTQQSGALERTNISTQSALERALAVIEAKDKAGGDFNPEDYIDESGGGYRYINIEKIPDRKKRQIAADYAAKNNIPVLKDRTENVLKLVDDARANIGSIKAVTDRLLASSTFDPKRITNMAQAWLGSGEGDLTAYNAYRTAAIQIIQTLAGLGTGLRINQAEINAALKYDIPRVNDTVKVANKKLGNLLTMIEHTEDAVLGIRESGKKESKSDNTSTSTPTDVIDLDSYEKKRKK